jgi:hypothetical protein
MNPEKVALFSHNGFRRFLFITEEGLPSGLNNGLAAFRTDEGSLFYMKPELNTGRHYNVGNKAFWVIRSNSSFAGNYFDSP